MERNLFAILILFEIGVFICMQFSNLPRFYRMQVNSDNYSDTSPSYINAKRWLQNTSRYKKINNTSLIDLQFKPINSFSQPFLDAIQGKFKKSNYTDLDEIANLPASEFYEWGKENISWEYLYSQFDRATQAPTIDKVYLIFQHKGVEYDLLTTRTFVEDNPYAPYTYVLSEITLKCDRPSDILSYETYLTQ